MKKGKLTTKESKKGIRAYALYVKKRNKKYLWFNEQLTEEEYKKRMKDVKVIVKN